MRALRVATVFGILLTTACGAGGDQHCVRNDDQGEVEFCYDIGGFEPSLFGFGLQASISLLCQVTGSPATAGTCPDEGKVGGCKGDEQGQYEYIEWEYTGTLEEVSCLSSDVKLGPDGQPVDGSGDDTGADTDVDTDDDTDA